MLRSMRLLPSHRRRPPRSFLLLLPLHAPRAARPSLSSLPVALLQGLEDEGLAGRESRAANINVGDRLRPYETFEQWGIVTLGDLAALPAAPLSSRLGGRGV